MLRRVFFAALLAVALPVFAQQGQGNECTPAGTWYGGSVVAYQMVIVPAGPAGHYTISAQGMYKNSVMNTTFTGEVTKNGNRLEGGMMGLMTQDPSFLNPPPIDKLPDIAAGWSAIEMVDCNTLKNTISVFGLYFGQVTGPAGDSIPLIWSPGSPWTGINWIAGGKVPLADAPDVDLIPILTGDMKPIVETYHRLPNKVNPALLHH